MESNAPLPLPMIFWSCGGPTLLQNGEIAKRKRIPERNPENMVDETFTQPAGNEAF
jgi:hypothetical protein